MRRKDLAEETRYFAHEDYELLRKLARKAKRSADEVNPEHGQKLRETERRELAKLVPSLRDGDLTKVLNWLHKDGTGTRAQICAFRVFLIYNLFYQWYIID